MMNHGGYTDNINHIFQIDYSSRRNIIKEKKYPLFSEDIKLEINSTNVCGNVLIKSLCFDTYVNRNAVPTIIIAGTSEISTA